MTIAQTGRLAISAIGVCAATMLAACGGPLTAPGTGLPAQTGAVSWARHDAGGTGCPLKRCIIVTRQNGYYNKPLPAVLFFARDAKGNISPVGEISGSKTLLSFPTGLAMDSRGNIYVANLTNAITVYAAGAEGNVAPSRTITGPKTRLNSPAGIAIDSQDELFVANQTNYDGHITIYASNANGDAAPIRTLRGSNTGLNSPWGVALDSQSNLYVANETYSGSVTVYAPDANGNATPLRTITGSATKLREPAGLAVDASGYVYVNDTSGYNTVAIFAPDADGDVAPLSYFTSGYSAFNIALDGHDNMYVTNVGYDDPPFIQIFAAGTIGNKGRLLRQIGGQRTKLIWPEGILVR
ncbi:MAG: NHL repeat-containing protein [Candidatus Cybelea sp.]|jgi:sugar lactone lactonase YvrE